MADHKNQHFVPRVLLRPFTKEAEGKSINLYNIRANRLIPDAPVKGQCARHYWYGEDGELESLLAKLEDMFGAARGRIIDGSNSEKDRGEVRLFMFIQHWRTATAAARLRHSYEQMNASSWAPNEPIPDDKKLVISSIHLGLKASHRMDDLKIRIVENRTKRDFIISDDPATMLNRFAREKLNGAAFGVASSGLIFVMPLSPRLSVIGYDGQVYSLDLKDGRAILTSESMVDAYNDMQAIKASENVYFRQWKDSDYVQSRVDAVRQNRGALATARTFVPDGEDDLQEHYRPGTVEEGRQAKRSLIAVQFNYPEPDRWIPALRYRTKPVTFYNGTAIGHVRKREWLHGDRRRARPRRPGTQEKFQIIRTRPRPVDEPSDRE